MINFPLFHLEKIRIPTCKPSVRIRVALLVLLVIITVVEQCVTLRALMCPVLDCQIACPACPSEPWSAAFAVVLDCLFRLYQVELVLVCQGKYETLARGVLKVLFRLAYLPGHGSKSADFLVITCVYQQDCVRYQRALLVKFLHVKIVLTRPVQQPEFFYLSSQHAGQGLEFTVARHDFRIHHD